LRDDVKERFDTLISLLDSKTKLLQLLLVNEKSVSDLIKNENGTEDEILKITEYQWELIESIELEDYNISRLTDEITGKYKLDFNKILSAGCSQSETEFTIYKNEILLHRNIINEIIDLKSRNNALVDTSQDDLKVQIAELERIGKLRLILPKDLQSS